MFGTDPLDELSIPDGTHVQEHDLVTDGDVLVGGQSTVELGVRGASLMAGERVRFDGDIEADGDCRLDMWCDVHGNVLVGNNAYLGERVHITGQLIVSGDLDIGDDVDIDQGFEANGWIVIRNPMPTIVFLFVYLSHLLRIGEEEAATEVAEEFLSTETDADPLMIPRGSRVSDDAWRVSTPAVIGDDCRLHGNFRATSITVGETTEVFGSLRAKNDITVGTDTVIHGDVTTKEGDVTVAPDAHIRGDISCQACTLSEAATVDGTIRARGDLTFTEPSPSQTRSPTQDDPSSDGLEEAEVVAATVPLGEGELSVAETGDASTSSGRHHPTMAGDSTGVAAIRPITESDVDWETLEARRGEPTTNGDADADDVSAVIAEAEKS